MKKGNRYFIMTFSGLNEDGELQNGKIEFRTKGGKHAREGDILEFIEETFNFTQVFISNIMELTESDFKDWIEGRNTPPKLGSGDDTTSFL